ncbi:MAG: hypothetical protein VB050_13220, partial [Geobacteraceae bacterium]|nr:hypothetical protein [Geobacteraceae bacterium]
MVQKIPFEQKKYCRMRTLCERWDCAGERQRNTSYRTEGSVYTFQNGSRCPSRRTRRRKRNKGTDTIGIPKGLRSIQTLDILPMLEA